MQNQQPSLPPRRQLTVAQVITAALASVSAAAIASSLGVAGTLLGAAVTSIVATLAGALYTHSLEQAHSRLRRQHFPRPGGVMRLRPPSRLSQLAWGRIAGRALLVFALTLGTITVVEVAARESLARLMGHAPAQDSGTTVGTVLHTVAQDVQPKTEPRPASTPEAATPPGRVAPAQALTTPSTNEQVTAPAETGPASTAPASGEPGQTQPTPVPTPVVEPAAPAIAPTAPPSVPTHPPIVPTTAPGAPAQP